MQPDQIAALEVLARRSLTAQELDDIESLNMAGNLAGIMDILSTGRTKKVPTEVGKGTILEVLGLTTGNAFLDVIDNGTDFRHAKHLLQDGRMRLDSNLVQTMLAQFVVGGVLSQAQSDALSVLCVRPDPVTAYEVHLALQGE